LGVGRVVHQLEQRQIAQLGTAVKVALRKNNELELIKTQMAQKSMLRAEVYARAFAVLHHDTRWTYIRIEIPESPGLRAQVASHKMMNGLSDERTSSN
jgi:hypothetical protein